MQLDESADDLEDDFLSMVGGTSHLLKTKFKTDCICMREQWPPRKHVDSSADLFVSKTRFRVHHYDTRHYYAIKLLQRCVRRRFLRRHISMGRFAMRTSEVIRTASECAMHMGSSRRLLDLAPKRAASEPAMSQKKPEKTQNLRVDTGRNARVSTSVVWQKEKEQKPRQ